MPWWTDPDSLTPPVTPERLLDTLALLFKQDLRQIGPGQWAAAVWHHPVRLSVHDGGPLLHVESLYGAAVVTGIDSLRAHIQATNASHWLSSNRLVPTDTGCRILASSWTPLASGAEEEQLRSTLGTVIGSTVGPLNDLAEERGLPAAEPVDDVAAAAATWEALETGLARYEAGRARFEAGLARARSEPERPRPDRSAGKEI